MAYFKTKNKLEQAYEKWLLQCQTIREATDTNRLKTETPKEKEQRIELLKKDYAKFVEYYFPHLATCKVGKFHIQAAKKILKTKNLKAVFEWARGHAKSMTFCCMIPMWLKARGELNVMVLVSKSNEKANALLGDLQAELANNKRYIDDFGEQFKFGDWREGEFSTADGCAFFALGRGQSPRGIRKGAHRPDYIVIDDLDDDELVLNPKRVRKLIEWIKTALFGALDMGRGRFIMVGNRIHSNSVLANIAKTENIFHTIVNAIDKNGIISWKEKYTLAEIQEAIAFMGFRNAQKEFFNNPISEGTVFKNDWIVYQKILSSYFKQFIKIIVYTDPSFKNTSTADFKASVALAMDKRGKLYILRCFVRNCTVSEMVRWHYDLFEEWHNLPVPVTFMMETSFAQDLLLQEFVKEGETRNMQLPIRKDDRKKPEKFGRIEAISPLFERGLIVWNEELKESPDFKTAVEQLLSIEQGTKTPDDFPDALEGAIWQLQRSVQLASAPLPTFYSRQRKNSY